MNKFLEKYKEERESGMNEFEALGIASMHIATSGTFKDLEIVYDFHMQDFLETSVKEFDRYKNYIETSYQRNMRLSGHRESDFYEK